MKISVITVSFNSAGTIRETLDSVSQQSHPDVEHIVVDGGSTDATLALVNQHGDRVRALISEPDDGIYDAMNKGLALAHGQAIGFLNADDIYAGPDVLSIVAESFAKGRADIVFGDLVYVSNNSSAGVVRTWNASGFTPRQLRLGWMPPHPTVFVSPELLQRIGGFDPAFRIAGDYDFLLRCFIDTRLRWQYIDQTLVRMRTGGVSNRSIRNLFRKSGEDWRALRKNRVGGLLTLVCKNLRKLPQLMP